MTATLPDIEDDRGYLWEAPDDEGRIRVRDYDGNTATWYDPDDEGYKDALDRFLTVDNLVALIGRTVKVYAEGWEGCAHCGHGSQPRRIVSGVLDSILDAENDPTLRIKEWWQLIDATLIPVRKVARFFIIEDEDA